MPANLPPQYLKVEAEFRQAAAPDLRLEKLRELYRLLPKHKGTEKLQSDLKQKMSELRDELEQGKKTGGKKSGLSRRVPREGAGQVALVGSPNSGKSALLAALTNAKPEVAPYPFTTRNAQPGIMMWEDVPVQLIDLPPIAPDFLESWVPSVIRSADVVLLTADLAEDDFADGLETVLALLAERHVLLVNELPYDDDDESTRHLKTLLVAAKLDADQALERLAILKEWFQARFPIAPVSAQTGEGLETLRRATYDLLSVIRIYTKAPGKPIDRTRPFTLPVGANVLDLARQVHQDLEHSLKFARVWSGGGSEPRTVKRDHELKDADLVELHVS